MSTSAGASSRLTLRSFWHDLPREGKFLLSTIIIDFVGNGLVMPFNVVYLHEVRGFELARVGLLLSLPALVGLLVVGPIGALMDRIGPRIVVICCFVIQITAHVSIGQAGQGFGLAVQLEAAVPELPREQAEALVQAAHQVCPYSNATRGNIVVELRIA